MTAACGQCGLDLRAIADTARKQVYLARDAAAGDVIRRKGIAIGEDGVVVLVGEVQLHVGHRHIRAQNNAARADVQLAGLAVLAGDGDAVVDDQRRHAALFSGVGKCLALNNDGIAIAGVSHRILKAGIWLTDAAVAHARVTHIGIDGLPCRRDCTGQQGQQQRRCNKAGKRACFQCSHRQRSLLGIDAILQLLACLKADRLTCRDLHHFLCAGIEAAARSALFSLKCAKAEQPHSLALLQRLRDRFKQAVHRFRNGLLCCAQLVCCFLDEFCLCHNGLPLSLKCKGYFSFSKRPMPRGAWRKRTPTLPCSLPQPAARERAG